jgi:hypothetical protein
MFGKPVERWVAKPTKILNHTGTVDSYLVIKCPLYLPDAQKSEADKAKEKTRITRTNLAKMLGVTSGAIGYWDDEKVLKRCAKKGIKIKITHKNIRIFERE